MTDIKNLVEAKNEIEELIDGYGLTSTKIGVDVLVHPIDHDKMVEQILSLSDGDPIIIGDNDSHTIMVIHSGPRVRYKTDDKDAWGQDTGDKIFKLLLEHGISPGSFSVNVEVGSETYQALADDHPDLSSEYSITVRGVAVNNQKTRWAIEINKSLTKDDVKKFLDGLEKKNNDSTT